MKCWQLKGLLAALALLAGLVVIAGTAIAQGRQDFTLVNKTGYDIYEVYVSPAKTSDWSDDVMDMDILPNGSSVKIMFPGDPNICIWDLAVVYDDEEEVVWSNFDLCTISRIALFYDKSTENTWAEFE